jgi:arylsulfotransferase ASST
VTRSGSWALPRPQAAVHQDDTCFLFSPSASYPSPFACLIDRRGRLLHAWSTGLDQPDPATDPPTYLRGWNHVELAADGSLYATVPLHSMLKLRPDSSLIWRIELPVHHDLDIGPDGNIHVLTEQPRRVPWRDGTHTLLDNSVTIIGKDSAVRASHSLYDVLTAHPTLRDLIDSEIERRTAATPGGPGDTTAGSLTIGALAPGRDSSRLLREAPGSPSDVLHANSVEVLAAHPAGLWRQGDVLVSLRNLDVIAVVDLAAAVVRWFWGPGELSGQHQPSALPGGNLLVFDNGQAAGRSRAVEVDPDTGQIVWQYTADPPQELFCELAGGCEQLASGNVLISDSQAGRAFEVTRDHRIVWAVQTRTRPSPGSSATRAEFYRMAAVPAPATVSLRGGDESARQLVGGRLRCETGTDLFAHEGAGS